MTRILATLLLIVSLAGCCGRAFQEFDHKHVMVAVSRIGDTVCSEQCTTQHWRKVTEVRWQCEVCHRVFADKDGAVQVDPPPGRK
jgi:ribosomal protein L37AE/L43A